MITVTLYGFDTASAGETDYLAPSQATASGAIDVTDYVTSARWSHTLTAPYESIELSLAMPWPEIERNVPGTPIVNHLRELSAGFWAVIRPKGGGPALAWGRAASVNTSLQINAQTGTETTHVRISCQSWAAGLLGQSRFVVAAKTDYVREGFSVQIKDYAKKMAQILSGSFSETPGQLLLYLYRALAKTNLPSTLSSREGFFKVENEALVEDEDGTGVSGASYTVADSIPLVFEANGCIQFAPLRSGALLPVAGSGLKVAGPPVPRGTVWQYLVSTFQAHPVIELFPSLEHPFSDNIPEHTVNPLEVDAVESKLDDEDPGLSLEASPAKASGGTAAQKKLREALGGSQPVLIYRMRPRLLAALRQTRAGRKLFDAELAGLYQQPLEIQTGSDTADEYIYSVATTDIKAFSLSVDDGQRCNAVTVKTPLFRNQSQFEIQGVAGMKTLVDDNDVTKNGLRMQTVEWPFYPPANTTVGVTIARKVGALSELLFTLLARVDSVGLSKATLGMRYRPEMKAGHWLTFQAASHSSTESDGSWTGYIESVSHSVSVADGGQIRAETQVQLSDVGTPPSVLRSAQRPKRAGLFDLVRQS